MRALQVCCDMCKTLIPAPALRASLTPCGRELRFALHNSVASDAPQFDLCGAACASKLLEKFLAGRLA